MFAFIWLECQNCRSFFNCIIDLNQEQAISSFRKMVLSKKEPKLDEFEALNQLRKAELTDTANYLHTHL